MFFLQFLRLEVVVVDLAVRGLAGLPRLRQRRFQAFLRNVEQVPVCLHVHAQVPRVLLDLGHSGLIVLRQLFFQDLEPLRNEYVGALTTVEALAVVLLLVDLLVVVLFIAVQLFQ